MIEIDELRLAVGFLGIWGIYVAVSHSRRWTGKPRLLADLLDSRLQYAAVGLVLSWAFPAGIRTTLALAADIATVLLAGIFGLIVGGSFDRRLLKRLNKPLIWFEACHLLLLLLGVWLLTYGMLQGFIEPIERSRGALMWAISGLAASGWMRHRRIGIGKSQQAGAGWLPSASALAGLIFAGIGFIQMRQGGFVIRQPLAFPQVIVVDGIWGEVLWCLVLGALVGLMVDLSTREVRRGHLFYWVGAGLLLGCGIAQVLGLEPLWVGLVAGIWLINATLRRLDLLKVLEQGQGLMRTILPGVMGWGLGGALWAGFDWRFAAWILFILLVAVPAVRLAAWHGLSRFFDKSIMRRTGVGTKQLLEFDDLALVVCLGLATLLQPEQAAALLAAVLFGQWLLHLTAVLVAEKQSNLTER